MPGVVVSSASPAEYPAACRALFAALPEPDRGPRSTRALSLIEAGEFDPAGLLVARDPAGPDGVAGAVLFQLHPGNAALVWPPGGDRPDVADALAAAVVERFRAAGVKQAQCVLPPAEEPRAGPLLRSGFRRVTDLTFLCRPVALTDADNGPAALTFHPADADLTRFGETLLATYDGTLDCPELNGTRSADEVLAGYRRSAGPDPVWFLARRGPDAVGVVMTAPGAQDGITELTYLGLVPAARGRGLGAELVRCVVRLAAAAGAEWVTLTADVRNGPAIRLYRRHGFREYDSQAVFLWTPAG